MEIFKKNGPNAAALPSDWLAAPLLTLAIIVSCLIAYPSFFTIDDAVNEILGDYRAMGEIWLSGHIPFILDQTMIGGNTAVNIAITVFHPLTIFLSVVLALTGSITFTAVSMAALSITIIEIACLYLGRYFSLGRLWTWSFTAFMAISPLFIYTSLTAWWNGAYAHAWFLVLWCNFLYLCRTPSTKNLILNFILTYCLLSTNAVNSIPVYAALIICSLVYRIKAAPSRTAAARSVLILIAPGFIALLCCMPRYIEYYYQISHSVVNRADAVFNNNYMTASWDQLFMTFYPTYYGFMTWLDGYMIVTMPIGFTSLFLPYALLSRRLPKRDPRLTLLIVLIVTGFVLCNLPSQFGQSRWSFRYIPFLDTGLLLLTFYILACGERKKLNLPLYVLVIALSAVIALSSGAGTVKHLLLLNAVSVTLLLLVPYFIRALSRADLRPAIPYLCLLPALSCLILMLFAQPTASGKYLLARTIAPEIEIPDKINTQGYFWGLNVNFNSPFLGNLNSTQFMLYGLKSVNGYTPFPDAELKRLFPNQYPTSLFDASKSLDSALKPYGNSTHCLMEVMNVSSLSLSEPLYLQRRDELARCGYAPVLKGPHNTILLSNPAIKSQHVYFYSELGADFVSLGHHDNNKDELVIIPKSYPRTVVFPRVYYPGYEARLGNQIIPLSRDLSGAFIAVHLPALATGTLELSFNPTTYRYSIFLLLIALLLFNSLLFYAHKINNAPSRQDGQTTATD